MNNQSMHEDLIVAKKIIYDPCKFVCSVPEVEPESAEYGACKFQLNNFSVLFRVAKVTPVKVGHFVTLWKRIANNPIQPHDVSDPIDFYIVSVRKDNHFGQFIFPKSVLCEEGVLSCNGKGGKLGMRIYPSWDKALNRQAQKTQQWQIKYFLEIPENGKVDFERVQQLIS